MPQGCIATCELWNLGLAEEEMQQDSNRARAMASLCSFPRSRATTPSNLMCSAASEYITNDSRRRPEREWPREREREPDVAIMCEEKRRLAGCGWPGCCHWNVKNPNLCHTQSIVHNHHTWETVSRLLESANVLNDTW
jgi:hypothetical protein